MTPADVFTAYEVGRRAAAADGFVPVREVRGGGPGEFRLAVTYARSSGEPTPVQAEDEDSAAAASWAEAWASVAPTPLATPEVARPPHQVSPGKGRPVSREWASLAQWEQVHDSTGCLKQLLAISGLVGVIVLLTAWYVGQTGELPFTWADGPYGIPVWAPPLVLGLITVLSVAIPVGLSRRQQVEPTFRDEIAVNRRNSVFLTIAIAAGLGLSAYVLAAAVSLRTSVGLAAAALAIVAALVSAAVSLGAGDHIVLTLSRAKKVRDGEQRELTDVVQELATAANLPPPTVWLIDDSAPNAFSIGRDPGHASLAVTSGLLDALDREQLEGVVAHEMAHIRNQDTRYSLFVAVLAGSTVLIADGFFKIVTFPFQLASGLFRRDGRTAARGHGSGGSWSLNFGSGGGGGGGGGGGDNGGGLILIIVAIVIFVLLVIVIAWVVKILTPLFDRIIQAAVSREREYLADATAVELGRDPKGLEEALVKVAQSEEVLEVANRATAPLYFVNPIRAFEKRAQSIYSTHPPIIDRVNRLRQLEGEAPLAAIPGAVDVD